MGREPDAADGVIFKEKKGGGEVRVFGEWLQDGEALSSIADDAEKECTGGKASYRVVKSQFMAISCYGAGQILYRLTKVEKDRLVTLKAEYSDTDRDTWGQTITRMGKSLFVDPDSKY